LSIKDIFDGVAAAGALGLALLGLWAFLSNRLHSDGELSARLTEKDAIIAYERAQKAEALDIAKRALASHDRLAEGIETRNDLDRERLRQGGGP
jgi:hypothetical protein